MRYLDEKFIGSSECSPQWAGAISAIFCFCDFMQHGFHLLASFVGELCSRHVCQRRIIRRKPARVANGIYLAPNLPARRTEELVYLHGHPFPKGYRLIGTPGNQRRILFTIYHPAGHDAASYASPSNQFCSMQLRNCMRAR
jgi:hypothetical protein